MLLRAVGLVRVDRVGRRDGLGADGQLEVELDLVVSGGVAAVLGGHAPAGAAVEQRVLALVEAGDGQAVGGEHVVALHALDLDGGVGLVVRVGDDELLHRAAVGQLLGGGHLERGRGDLNRHIFGCEVRIARTGCLSSHGHLAIGDVLHARGRGRPLAVADLVVNGVAIGGIVQRSGREVIRGIVGPGATRQGELSALHSGGLDLEVALFHSHAVVVVGGVVGIQHILIDAYGLAFVCALVGHGSKIVAVHEPRYSASKGGVFLSEELLGVLHRDGGLALSNLEIVLRRQLRQVFGGGPSGFHLVRASVGGLGADPLTADEIGVGGRAIKCGGRVVGLGHGSLFGLRRIAVCPVVELHAGFEGSICRLLDLQPAIGHNKFNIVVFGCLSDSHKVILGKTHRISSDILATRMRTEDGHGVVALADQRRADISDAHVRGDLTDVRHGEARYGLLLAVVLHGLSVAGDPDREVNGADRQRAVLLHRDRGLVVLGGIADKFEHIGGEVHFVDARIRALGHGRVAGLQCEGETLGQGRIGEALHGLFSTCVIHGLFFTGDLDGERDAPNGEGHFLLDLDIAEELVLGDDGHARHTLVNTTRKISPLMRSTFFVRPLVGDIEQAGDINVIAADHVQLDCCCIKNESIAVIILDLGVGVQLDPAGVDVVRCVSGLRVHVYLRTGLVRFAGNRGGIARPPAELVSARSLKERLDSLDGGVVVVHDGLVEGGVPAVVGVVHELSLGILRSADGFHRDPRGIGLGVCLGNGRGDAGAGIVGASVVGLPVEELLIPGRNNLVTGSLHLREGVGAVARAVEIGDLVAVLVDVLDLDDSLGDPGRDELGVVGDGGLRGDRLSVELPAAELVAGLHGHGQLADLLAVVNALVGKFFAVISAINIEGEIELDRLELRVQGKVSVGHRRVRKVELLAQRGILVPTRELHARMIGSALERRLRVVLNACHSAIQGSRILDVGDCCTGRVSPIIIIDRMGFQLARNIYFGGRHPFPTCPIVCKDTIGFIPRSRIVP